ncbi:tRNA uridine-5-carboxymethylaminomethyl(34) synthesis GTPase MnmE [Thermosipho ferrireducens]|uniref:tRNA modification GTPase MnmE n=1 Tax=Thermosipho ferrireducens TaxID=2571116 RepID=A0ABX7S7X4_9BACT|nr:tRNA uridine-5-carboxymethylaminomethyl(34) synthesis GTPase MnmE [Thermosipho ferrireducens]QTA37215.1 tRNA uridine-5-carboxymethylaminomethyl(34) synthesis GTPase MnmE [Thermosipho ferrireducens]
MKEDVSLERETFAAISSPVGTGAIGVVRINGPESHKIVKKLMSKRIDDIKYRMVYHVELISENQIIDEVNLVFYKAPNSFTGDDMVEIYCHGGVIVTRKVLDALIRNGARLAERGEFTRRAFLNGKINLIEAESIYRIIEAKSEKALKIAMQNLKGALGKEIEELREELLNILAEIEVSIDYPDDIEIDENKIYMKLEAVAIKVKKKILEGRKGLHLSTGVVMAIVGKPNTGKSTLLNRLLYEDRAIVTDIPGTTRDVIKGEIDIRGVHFIIADTAGIRKTEDPIEKIGIERSIKEIQKADIILFVLDATTGFTNEDEYIYERIKSYNYLPVWNKIDTNNNIKELEIPHIEISALTGKGIRELEKKIVERVKEIIESGETSHVITYRQYEALQRAYKYLDNALKGLKIGLEFDVISIDIRKCLEEFDKLIGRTFSDDLLNTIFSNFCVGK